MNSSISNSDTTDSDGAIEIHRHWIRVLLFGAVALVLILTNEFWVRRAEVAYGIEPVIFHAPYADEELLAAFINNIRDGRSFAMYCVGSSVCIYGLHPNVLAHALPAELYGVYDLGFPGSSALCGLDILSRLHITPAVLVVSVTPFDFTASAVARGEKIIQHGEDTKELLPPDRRVLPAFDLRRMLEAWARDRTWGILHSASAARHRTIAQWCEFFPAWHASRYSQTVLLRFLNNSDPTIDEQRWRDQHFYVEFFTNGYLGLKLRRLIDAAQFDRECYQPYLDYLQTKIAPEYQRDHEAYIARMRTDLETFRQKGTHIVLVRIPQYAPLDDRENQLLNFDNDMKQLANFLDAPYLSIAIVPKSFTSNRDNFRDASHLHYESSITYSQLLVPYLRRR